MSIADHFDHTPDAGFVRNYDAGSAQRQFKVSLMLVVVIVLAASALGFLVNFDQPVTSGAVAPVTPTYVGALTR